MRDHCGACQRFKLKSFRFSARAFGKAGSGVSARTAYRSPWNFWSAGLDDNSTGAAHLRRVVRACFDAGNRMWRRFTGGRANRRFLQSRDSATKLWGGRRRPTPYRELETKYLFGFTEGADIGAEGERAIELETTTELGLRTGTYGTTAQQELEYEGVPTQYFGYELQRPRARAFPAADVDGMADAHGFNSQWTVGGVSLLGARSGTRLTVWAYVGRRTGMGPDRRWRTADH